MANIKKHIKIIQDYFIKINNAIIQSKICLNFV